MLLFVRTCDDVSCPCAHIGATEVPEPCGGVTVFCPAGSLAPTPVTDGYYTAVSAGMTTNATNTMAQAVDCPAGSYCNSGVRHYCPPATFLGGSRRFSLSSCEGCTAGGFCSEGSSRPLPCGNDSVFCPAGSAAPSEGACHCMNGGPCELRVGGAPGALHMAGGLPIQSGIQSSPILPNHITCNSCSCLHSRALLL